MRREKFMNPDLNDSDLPTTPNQLQDRLSEQNFVSREFSDGKAGIHEP
jgi:hypothetical protein